MLGDDLKYSREQLPDIACPGKIAAIFDFDGCSTCWHPAGSCCVVKGNVSCEG